MIYSYNSRAKEWVRHGWADFKAIDLFLASDNVTQQMEEVYNTPGEFYPVRDSCNYEGDPKDGCIYTEGIYYLTEVDATSDSLNVVIFNNGSAVVDRTFPTSAKRQMSVRDLDCNHLTLVCMSSFKVGASVLKSAISLMEPGIPIRKRVTLLNILVVFASV